MNASLARICEELDRHIKPIPEETGFTAMEYAKAKGVAETTARRSIAKAVESGLIEVVGVRKNVTSMPVVYDFTKKAKCKSKK